MPALYPLFYNNLQDNIPSVRQGAALALANVAQVYGNFKKQFYQTKICFSDSFNVLYTITVSSGLTCPFCQRKGNYIIFQVKKAMKKL